MAKQGRKPATAKTKQSQVAHVYLTKDEKAKLLERAKARGLPLATHLRMLALLDAGLVDR